MFKAISHAFSPATTGPGNVDVHSALPSATRDENASGIARALDREQTSATAERGHMRRLAAWLCGRRPPAPQPGETAAALAHLARAAAPPDSQDVDSHDAAPLHAPTRASGSHGRLRPAAALAMLVLQAHGAEGLRYLMFRHSGLNRTAFREMLNLAKVDAPFVEIDPRFDANSKWHEFPRDVAIKAKGNHYLVRSTTGTDAKSLAAQAVAEALEDEGYRVTRLPWPAETANLRFDEHNDILFIVEHPGDCESDPAVPFNCNERAAALEELFGFPDHVLRFQTRLAKLEDKFVCYHYDVFADHTLDKLGRPVDSLFLQCITEESPPGYLNRSSLPAAILQTGSFLYTHDSRDILHLAANGVSPAWGIRIYPGPISKDLLRNSKAAEIRSIAPKKLTLGRIRGSVPEGLDCWTLEMPDKPGPKKKTGSKAGPKKSEL